VCRERTVFPWRGVLLTPVEINGTVLQAGELIRVEGKHNGVFTISALPLFRGLTGSAAASAVDEPVCARIERELLGNLNLRWGDSQASWRGLGRANQNLELSEEEGPPVSVTAGEVVTLLPSGSPETYAVRKADQLGLIPIASITVVDTLPLPTAQLQLMCYELAPYAAERVGLGQGFMRTANHATCFGKGGAGTTLEYWAQSIGAQLHGPEIVRSQLSTAGLQRGDLVHFYIGDTPQHTAVATGDGEWVYSLWHMPVNYTVRVTLSDLWEDGLKKMVLNLTHIRAATPAWHHG
jgi:hypothetical protein